jgi:hypothetical protein
MTQLNTIIDTVKDSKGTFLKTFVQDNQIRKPLQAIVDAEAELAKLFAKSVEDFASKFKAFQTW